MRMLLGCLLLVSSSSLAHIHLDAPGSFQTLDALGNPQKTEPCGGAGTPSGVVTTVMAGSQLTVSWRETILHPGHFRIGIARQQSDFMTPIPVLNMGGANCQSAPIQSSPSYPTLVDGLYQHTTAAPGNMYSTTVTVPMMSCDNCVLQLMQFMSAHSPPCFYYQCAALKIVMPDAGTGTGGGGGSTGGGGGATGGGTGGGSGGGSGAPPPCSAVTCAGCCTFDGRCELGTSDVACGIGGLVCASCNGSDACQAGQCKPQPRGCGCGALDVLASVLALGLLTRRRRDARG